MTNLEKTRIKMVETQIYARGVRDPKVLMAMAQVPREVFVPVGLRDLAYADRPLPIEAGQTISQPYIVAYMVEALGLQGGEKILEIGAGSGYAAAVLAEIATEVYTVESIVELADYARHNLKKAGYDNVHILRADGTEGWKEKAPFDAILVSAGAPEVPHHLLEQLVQGGRIVVPVGPDKLSQELVRITKIDTGKYVREDLADVRFVPLIGKHGWEEDDETLTLQSAPPRVVQKRPAKAATLPGLIAGAASVFESPDSADLDALIKRAGEAKVVLIGEASHGTSEFYRMRAQITKRLIEEKGFNIVAAEADWPDAAQIDNYVRHHDVPPSEWTTFARFPTWMWRNEEVREFINWLHVRNEKLPAEDRTGFYGLDVYSLYTSAGEVIKYLEGVDPDLAELARRRYGCLSPWEADPAAYGRAALMGEYRSCEDDIVNMLTDLLRKRQEHAGFDSAQLFSAEQNAAVVAAAEKYYRIMYYGSRASWNLRDQHMFDTLGRIRKHRGDDAKAVVWAHNSHIGNATATEMSKRGEYNIGQLCREAFGDESYHIGFGTHDGTVAAATEWGGPMEIKKVRPSHPQSYEHIFHLTNAPGLILQMDSEKADELRPGLSHPRLERAIGVIYRPETELASHYFEAVLPRQFDAYIWIDHTRAVTPIPVKDIEGMPDTYPFGV